MSRSRINQLTQTGNDLLEQINKLAVPANEILNKANQGEGTLGRIVNDESLYRNLDATVERNCNDDAATRYQQRATAQRENFSTIRSFTISLNRTVAQLEGISIDIRAGRGTAGKFVTRRCSL